MKTLLPFLALLICIPSLTYPQTDIANGDEPPQFSSKVVGKDGHIHLDLQVPIKNTAYTRKLTLIGTASLKNGESIELKHPQDRTLAASLAERLRAITLQDLSNEDFKEDLKLVIEEAIQAILKDDREVQLKLDKLLVT